MSSHNIIVSHLAKPTTSLQPRRLNQLNTGTESHGHVIGKPESTQNWVKGQRTCRVSQMYVLQRS